MDDIVEHNYQLMTSHNEGGMPFLAESVGGSGGATPTGGRTQANYSFFFQPNSGEIVGFYLKKNSAVPSGAYQGMMRMAFPPLHDLRPERYEVTGVFGHPDIPLSSCEVDGSAIAILERTRKVYNERQQEKVRGQLESLGL